nr:proline-rich protein 34 [Aotus nancymaae]
MRPAPGPGRMACCPLSAHPVPTQGALTFWAPGPWPRVLLVPRSPGPVLRALRSPHPAARARRRAWHGARLPGSPARAGQTFQ